MLKKTPEYISQHYFWGQAEGGDSGPEIVKKNINFNKARVCQETLEKKCNMPRNRLNTKI